MSKHKCARCGTDPAEGYAGMTDADGRMVRLCHEGDSPTCYELGLPRAEAAAPPPPGSPQAVALGCSCPVLDNGMARATYHFPEGRWVISLSCPLHGRKEA